MKRLLNLCLSTVLLACLIVNANDVSGKDMLKGSSATLSGTGLAKDSIIVATDDFSVHWNSFALQPPSDTSWRNNVFIKNTRGRVILRVKEPVTECSLDTFSEEIKVRLYSIDPNNILDSVDRVLKVTFRKNSEYQAIDFFELQNVCYLRAKILTVSNTNSTVRSLVELEAEVDQERVFSISESTLNSNPPSLTITDSTNDKGYFVIQISATSSIFEWVEEYDLEWTFVDGYDKNFNLISPSSCNFDIKNNTTRVTIKDKIYRVSNVFEKGYVVFRVRAVGRGVPQVNQRVEGPWNWQVAGSVANLQSNVPSANYITISGTKQHEDSLNWQYKCTYAEEGKKKEIVDYYDGSLRMRQSVTRSNTNNFALVQDKIYDHQGRPAIEVLPAPATPNKFQFFRKFSKSSDGGSYLREDFDLDASACVSPVDSMKTTSGASNYYSKLSSFINAGPEYQKYVPVAGGYPFVQKEFTPDNTGRIRRATMPGINHKLDSMHETVYYYGVPFQEELDRLFGSEAGFNIHYQKEMVKDPNGQLSVSYKNASGKVVATALAGSGIAGMDNLDSNAVGPAVLVNLVDSTENSYENDALITRRTFLVTHESDYKFVYSINGKSLNPGCVPANFCLDCVYDLNISLTNMCNKEELKGDYNQPSNKVLINKTIGGALVDTLCQTPSKNNYSFKTDTLPQKASATDSFITVRLYPGEYTVTKTLRVNKDALEFYTEAYLKSQNCKTVATLENEIWSTMDTTSCEITCVSCNTKLGTQQRYLDSALAKLKRFDTSVVFTYADTVSIVRRYVQSKKECDKLCDTIFDMCGSFYEILKADVSPGGLYGKINYNDTAATVSKSVFYGNSAGLIKTFVDLDVFKRDSLTINGVRKAYARMTNWEFISNWQDTFADHLVQLHPEYCYYTWCKNNAASNTFDYGMLTTDDYETALSKGYLYPVDTAGSADNDPFFKTSPLGVGNAVRGSLSNLLKQYKGVTIYNSDPSTTTEAPVVVTLSMWDLQIGSIYCGSTAVSDTMAYVKCIFNNRANLESCSPAVKNLYWTLFRGMYLAEKTRIKDSLQTKYIQNNSTCSLQVATAYADTLRHSPQNMSLPAGYDAKLAKATVDLDTACAQQCRSYADNWIFKLQQCSLMNTQLSQGQIDLLKKNLIQVCRDGCDGEHPFGSSTVATAKLNDGNVMDKSFHDVLVRMGIYKAGVCDELLISIPKPYDHDFQAYNSYKSDSCACDTALYNYPLGKGSTVKDTVTVPNSNCSTCTKNVQAMNKNLVIPSNNATQYKCKSCISCEKFDIAMHTFNLDYANVYTDTSVYNELFTNYMNNRFSFNLTFDEYERFAIKCSGDTAQSVYDVLERYKTFQALASTVDVHPKSIIDYDQVIGESYIVSAPIDNSNNKYLFAAMESEPSQLDYMSDVALGKDPFVIFPGRYGAMDQFSMNSQGNIAEMNSMAGSMYAPPSPPSNLDRCGCDSIMRMNRSYELNRGSATSFKAYVEGVTLIPQNAAALTQALKYCHLAFERGGGSGGKAPRPVKWAPGALWSEQANDLLQEYVSDNSLTLDQLFSCRVVSVDPLTHGAPSGNPIPCSTIMSQVEGKYNSSYNTNIPFLQDLYDNHSTVVDDLISKLNELINSQNYDKYYFDRDNFYLRFLKCRTEIICSSILKSHLATYVNANSGSFNFSQPLAGQLLNGTNRPAALAYLNSVFNKSPYFYYFDSAALAKAVTCKDYICNEFRSQITAYIWSHGDHFNPDESYRDALFNDEVRAELIPILNSTFNRPPYMTFFDTAMYRSIINQCLGGGDFCPLFSSIIDSLINEDVLDRYAPISAQLAGDALTTVLYRLNQSSNRNPFYVFFDDSTDVLHYLNTCGQSLPCDSMYAIFTRFVKQYESVLKSDYRSYLYQLTEVPGKAWLMDAFVAMINQSSHKYPYFKQYYRSDVVSILKAEGPTACFNWSCCILSKDFSWADPFSRSLLNVFPSSTGSNTVPPKAPLLTSSGWYLDNDLAPIYRNNATYSYKNRNDLMYSVTNWKQRLHLGAVIVGDVDEPAFNIKFDAIVDDSLTFRFKWVKSMSYLSIQYFPVDCKGKLVIHYSADFYPNGDFTATPHPALIDVTLDAFAFITSKKCLTSTDSIMPEIFMLCNRPLAPDTLAQENPCKAMLRSTAHLNALNKYQEYSDSIAQAFKTAYIRKCMEAFRSEVFTMQYYERQYQYTLYYYDQAGNLTKTVPPKGVKPLYDPVVIKSINEKRLKDLAGISNAIAEVFPAHKLATRYQYNTLNQLIWQSTPDAGVSNFYYDALGRMVLSANANQALTADYSYTYYDKLGRIEEVGQVHKTSFDLATVSQTGSLRTEVNAGTKTQVTKTFYDYADPIVAVELVQDNLRNRVSKMTYSALNDVNTDYAIYYTYDIAGNVKVIVRQASVFAAIGQEYKKVEYEFDLISGKVNAVYYQRGYSDQYIHKYDYDGENRLITSISGINETVSDEVFFENGVDARYQYYFHGPLARTELGDLKVQGVDYAYTVNGWLKGVNSSTLLRNRDIGKDGVTGKPNALTGLDVYGFTLNYYEGDYQPALPLTGSNAFYTTTTSSGLAASSSALYNGNISSMTVAISKFIERGTLPLASVYKYDQLNRLRSANYFTNIDVASNAWQSGGATPQWHNRFEYDENGNILKQVRRSSGMENQTLAMDSLGYEYYTDNNRLKRVTDITGANAMFTDDVNDQADANNYVYDEIGNLIQDKAEEINQISWNVYGKITKIARATGSTKPDLEFEYSPDGHRVLKIVKPKSPGALNQYVYYMRDAQGNILATYERTLNKIVDFDTLLYAKVNDSIIELINPSSNDGLVFGMFLDANANNGGLLNNLEDLYEADPPEMETFLRAQSTQSVVNNFDYTYRMVNRFDPKELMLWLRGNTGNIPVQFLAPCEYMGELGFSETMIPEYWIRNEQARNALFKSIFQYNMYTAQSIMAYLGYPSWSYQMEQPEFDFLRDFYNQYPSGYNRQYTYDQIIAALAYGGIDFSSCSGAAGYFGSVASMSGGFYGYEYLLDAAAKMPYLQKINQFRSLNSCATASTPLLEWLMSTSGGNVRESMLRALWTVNVSWGSYVAGDLMLNNSSEDASVYDLVYASSLTPEDVYNAIANRGYNTEELLISFYTHYQDEYETAMASYPDINDAFSNTYCSSLNIIADRIIPNNAGYSYAYVVDMSNRNQAWNILLDYPNMTDYFSVFKTSIPVSVLQYTMARHKQWVSNYQQANNIYSPSGNGMKTYFDKVRQHPYLGQTFYDNLLTKFYNVSNAYSDSFNLNEWIVYGSSRLGSHNMHKKLVSVKVYGSGVTNGELNSPNPYPVDDDAYDMVDGSFQIMRGRKHYELSNHLGNVLAVISDRKVYNCGDYLVNSNFDSGDLDLWLAVANTTYTLYPMAGALTAQAATAAGGSGLHRVMNHPGEIGKTYEVSFDVNVGNTTGGVFVQLFGISTSLDYRTFSSSGHYSYTFTPTTDIIYRMKVGPGSGTSVVNQTFTIDNFKIKLYETDSVYYTADVIRADDYSPFGAPMDERKWRGPAIAKQNIYSNTFKDVGSTNDWAASGTGVNISIRNQCMYVAMTSSSVPAGAKRTFDTKAGGRYRLSFATLGSSYPALTIKDVSSSKVLLHTGLLKFGMYAYEFTATGNTTEVHILEEMGNSGKITIDNVSLDEIEGGVLFGFNGMERDDEVSGAGNEYSTEYRQYDPRLGRWMSIDPLFRNFPWQSPYAAFDNNPIVVRDPKGLAGEKVTGGGDGKKQDKENKRYDKLVDKLTKKYKDDPDRLNYELAKQGSNSKYGTNSNSNSLLNDNNKSGKKSGATGANYNAGYDNRKSEFQEGSTSYPSGPAILAPMGTEGQPAGPDINVTVTVSKDGQMVYMNAETMAGYQVQVFVNGVYALSFDPAPQIVTENEFDAVHPYDSDMKRISINTGSNQPTTAVITFRTVFTADGAKVHRTQYDFPMKISKVGVGTFLPAASAPSLIKN